jgi:hypothetical protein
MILRTPFKPPGRSGGEGHDYRRLLNLQAFYRGRGRGDERGRRGMGGQRIGLGRKGKAPKGLPRYPTWCSTRFGVMVNAPASHRPYTVPPPRRITNVPSGLADARTVVRRRRLIALRRVGGSFELLIRFFMWTDPLLVCRYASPSGVDVITRRNASKHTAVFAKERGGRAGNLPVCEVKARPFRALRLY